MTVVVQTPRDQGVSVGYEVLTAVNMNNIIFCDIMQFGGTPHVLEEYVT
jgi:hypothetical protein